MNKKLKKEAAWKKKEDCAVRGLNSSVSRHDVIATE